MLSKASVSTWGFSHTLTIRTALPLKQEATASSENYQAIDREWFTVNFI